MATPVDSSQVCGFLARPIIVHMPSGALRHRSSHGWNRHRPSEMTSTLPSLTRTAVSSSMK